MIYQMEKDSGASPELTEKLFVFVNGRRENAKKSGRQEKY